MWMQQIAQLDLSSTWVFGVRWSASGKTLAYAGYFSTTVFFFVIESLPKCQMRTFFTTPFVTHNNRAVALTCTLIPGHNSMIYFVDEVESAPAAQNLALRDLPLRDVGQHFPF
jgi:actin related protein 2/3 complex subunit 1A/1B